MASSPFDNPAFQLALAVAGCVLLVLVLLWLAYRAIKAGVREGIREARLSESRQSWLPTQRQSLDEGGR